MIVKCKSDNDSVGKLKGLTIDRSYPVTGIDNIGNHGSPGTAKDAEIIYYHQDIQDDAVVDRGSNHHVGDHG